MKMYFSAAIAMVLVMTMQACGMAQFSDQAEPQNKVSAANDTNGTSGSIDGASPTHINLPGSIPIYGEYRLSGFIGGPEVPPDTGATLIISADGRVSGRGTCNSFGGSFASKDNGNGKYEIAIRDVVSTQRACGESYANYIEQLFFRVLYNANKALVSDRETLVIYGDQWPAKYVRVK